MVFVANNLNGVDYKHAIRRMKEMKKRKTTIYLYLKRKIKMSWKEKLT